MGKYRAYHGSPNEIKQWDYDKIGTHGTMEGFGFYFTSSYKVAKGYANGGFVYHVRLTFNKPIIAGSRRIDLEDIKKLLKAADPDGDGFLSNYGDVDYEGYDSVLETSAEALDNYNDDDVDIINEIYRTSPIGLEEFYNIVKDTLGYDSIADNNPKWGEQIIYVAWFNDQIEITEVEKITKDETVQEQLKRIIKEEVEDFYTDIEKNLMGMKDRMEDKIKILKRYKSAIPSDYAEEKRAKQAEFEQAEEDLEALSDLEKELEDQKGEIEKMQDTMNLKPQGDTESITKTQSFSQSITSSE